jgi:hypothetical protein
VRPYELERGAGSAMRVEGRMGMAVV